MPVVAEDFGSLRSHASFGQFTSTLDAAFSPVPGSDAFDITTLSHHYLFTGLTNAQGLAAEGSFRDVPFQIGGHIRFGPVSGLTLGTLVGMDREEVPDIEDDIVVDETQILAGVDDNGDPVDYEWVSQTTETKFGAKKALADRYALTTFFGINAFRMGIDAEVTRAAGDLADAEAWVTENRTTIERHFYTEAGAQPDPQLDYEITTTRERPATTLDVAVEMPVAIVTPRLAHLITLSWDMERADYGSSVTVDHSSPATAALAPTYTVDAVDSVTGGRIAHAGSIDYRIRLFSQDSAGGRDYLDVAAGGAVDAPLDSTRTELSRQETFNVNTSGAEVITTPGAVETTETTTVSDALLRWGAWLETGYHVRRDISGALSAAVEPAIRGRVDFGAQSADYHKTRRTAVVSEYDTPDTLSRTTTTTTSYTGLDAYDGLLIDASFSLPSAVLVRPPGWPVFFVLGSQVDLQYRYSRETLPVSLETETVVITEDGEELSSTRREEVAPPGWSGRVTNESSEWTILHENRLALLLQLPGDVSLDISLEGESIFAFNTLSVQFHMPLGRRSAGAPQPEPQSASESEPASEPGPGSN